MCENCPRRCGTQKKWGLPIRMNMSAAIRIQQKRILALAITDIEGSIRELRLFAEAGGSAIVEGTAADYGRDPQKLVYASRQSGVHLIATAGFYLFDHNPDFIDDISTEELAELFIREIEEGMDGTEDPGRTVKCAVSPRFIHPREEKCLELPPGHSRSPMPQSGFITEG